MDWSNITWAYKHPLANAGSILKWQYVQCSNIHKVYTSKWPHSFCTLLNETVFGNHGYECESHEKIYIYRKPPRYSTGCCMAALCSKKKEYFIEPAPRSPQFLFILLYFGRYAYMSSAVCQIYDYAWQNYTRNYFSSMYVVMNHICANFLGNLFKIKTRSEVEHVSFNAFI